jgi:predicted ArsR family transcriptional regulator
MKALRKNNYLFPASFVGNFNLNDCCEAMGLSPEEVISTLKDLEAFGIVENANIMFQNAENTT